MHRKNIIQQALALCGDAVYLEIGVLYGTVFTDIVAKKKVAVDPLFQLSWKRRLRYMWDLLLRGHFFEMTSDAFFEKYAKEIFTPKKPNVVFIDGLHTYEQSLRDVENALMWLADGGVILLHDCNPPTEEREKEMYSGDVWKTMVHMRTRDDVTAFVINEDCGIGVVVKQTSLPEVSLALQDIPTLSYEDLARQRELFLGIRTYNEWLLFMKKYANLS